MFRIRQYIKMLLQNVMLPIIYALFCHMPVRKGSVIFADAHHKEVPFSMRYMYETMRKEEQKGNCRIEVFIDDFQKMSFGAMLKYLLRFMKRYATAETVIICDYFLPVAACKKRKETKVIQLWHSCGLMKKIAYDTGQDIPENYRGNMFGNYTYLTLSAEICVPVHSRALRLAQDHIVATGVSRTDYYFDEQWNDRCRKAFYEAYPEAVGKKIALWASTFRGNAAMPTLEGLEAIRSVQEQLSDEWYLIIKAHPHIDAHGMVSNCSIPTEELLAVADVMITDYSSVLFDYLLYNKPAVLFAPDLRTYEDGRGFYLNYREIPYEIAENAGELKAALVGSFDWYQGHKEDITVFRNLYVGACDGHSTERILKLMKK